MKAKNDSKIKFEDQILEAAVEGNVGKLQELLSATLDERNVPQEKSKKKKTRSKAKVNDLDDLLKETQENDAKQAEKIKLAGRLSDILFMVMQLPDTQSAIIQAFIQQRGIQARHFLPFISANNSTSHPILEMILKEIGTKALSVALQEEILPDVRLIDYIVLKNDGAFQSQIAKYNLQKLVSSPKVKIRRWKTSASSRSISMEAIIINGFKRSEGRVEALLNIVTPGCLEDISLPCLKQIYDLLSSMDTKEDLNRIVSAVTMSREMAAEIFDHMNLRGVIRRVYPDLVEAADNLLFEACKGLNVVVADCLMGAGLKPNSKVFKALLFTHVNNMDALSLIRKTDSTLVDVLYQRFDSMFALLSNYGLALKDCVVTEEEINKIPNGKIQAYFRTIQYMGKLEAVTQGKSFVKQDASEEKKSALGVEVNIEGGDEKFNRMQILDNLRWTFPDDMYAKTPYIVFIKLGEKVSSLQQALSIFGESGAKEEEKDIIRHYFVSLINNPHYNINQVDCAGKSLLPYLIELDNKGLITQALEAGASIKQLSPKDQYQMLIHSIIDNRSDLVSSFLKSATCISNQTIYSTFPCVNDLSTVCYERLNPQDYLEIIYYETQVAAWLNIVDLLASKVQCNEQEKGDLSAKIKELKGDIISRSQQKIDIEESESTKPKKKKKKKKKKKTLEEQTLAKHKQAKEQKLAQEKREREKEVKQAKVNKQEEEAKGRRVEKEVQKVQKVQYAQVLQACLRTLLAKGNLQGLKAESYFKQKLATKSFQQWRGATVASKEEKEQEEKATQHSDMALSERVFKKWRVVKDNAHQERARETSAATIIQSVYRGHLVRRSISEQKTRQPEEVLIVSIARIISDEYKSPQEKIDIFFACEEGGATMVWRALQEGTDAATPILHFLRSNIGNAGFMYWPVNEKGSNILSLIENPGSLGTKVQVALQNFNDVYGSRVNQESPSFVQRELTKEDMSFLQRLQQGNNQPPLPPPH
jgi:hypothetical protein